MSLFLVKNNKKTLVTKNVIHRRTIFSRAFGLMFHSKIFDEAHIFYFNHSQRLSLTMFFVFFPIDVVFLKKGVVVELKKNFRPFSNYSSKTDADIFIELPVGFIDKYNLIIGSELFF